MTRINLVDPKELMDQHLLAEYREIRLLTANLQRSLASSKGVKVSTLPSQFTLNTGHVRFFYNKGLYLHKRYNALKAELIARGFAPMNNFEREKWPDHLYHDWQPSERDKNIVRERIALRLSQRPNWYRYYGKQVEVTENECF